MKLHLLALFPIVLLLTACGASDRQMLDYSQVERAGVSPAVYDKMVNGDPLGISDIIVISKAHVPSDIVIRYIRDHETIYVVTQANISEMQKAGVDPSIVDYILQTAQSGYWGNGAYPYFGNYDPYFYANPFYGGYFGYGYHRGNWHGGHYHGHYHGQYHHH
jgi:hypothetical protein